MPTPEEIADQQRGEVRQIIHHPAVLDLPGREPIREWTDADRAEVHRLITDPETGLFRSDWEQIADKFIAERTAPNPLVNDGPTHAVAAKPLDVHSALTGDEALITPAATATPESEV